MAIVKVFEWWRRRNASHRRQKPVRVILWSKPDCCLCEHAHDVLARVAKDYPLAIEEHDITSDAVAFERYRYAIPVVEIAGGPKFEGKITEFWLRRALEQDGAAAK